MTQPTTPNELENSTRPAAPVGPVPTTDQVPIDSILFVSFGGPEGPEDVIPFLENVLRGKNVPRDRMLEVADHYHAFGGVSPINAQCRELIAAVETELRQRGISHPIYWGNRNWHPLLPDTMESMAHDGRRRAIAFFTSIFSSYSGCRQYRENIAAAQSQVGEKAPIVEKVRMGYNHPRFVAAQIDCLTQALSHFDADQRGSTKVIFCAHSIPMSMATNSDYVRQLEETARLVCEAIGHQNWELAFQSRSGPPHQPWLEPDVCDRTKELHEKDGLERLVVIPLGFISDHIEVLYDLDEELASLCQDCGIDFVRGPTVGTHPEFVKMIADLIEERLSNTSDRSCEGTHGPAPDLCRMDCCLYPETRRPSASATTNN